MRSHMPSGTGVCALKKQHPCESPRFGQLPVADDVRTI